MLIYVGNVGAKKQRRIILDDNRLRIMVNPDSTIASRTEGNFALDNGAWTAHVNDLPFNDYKFIKAFNKARNGFRHNLDFVVLPDKIAQGKKSLDYSIMWRSILPDGILYYLAVQDDMTEKMVEPFVNQIDGIFIGGSLEWKLETGETWVQFAHKHNLKAHIGRVGILKRLLWAQRIGADSVDSTTFVQKPSGWKMLMSYLKTEQRRLM